MLNKPSSIADANVVRFFEDHTNEIRIAHEAVAVATTEAKQLMERLGVHTMYGCPVEQGPEPEYSGEIDRIRRDTISLQDAARELRGLCETLNAKL